MITKKLATNTVLDPIAMAKEVYRSYAIATLDDVLYTEGYTWWNRASNDCHVAVNDFAHSGISVEYDRFCGFVSCVSPSRFWRKNVNDAIHGVFAWNQFPDNESRIAHCLDCRVGAPYGWSGFARGWQVLDGTRKMNYKTGPKTYSMTDNLIDPDHSLAITVDQHIVHLMLNDGLQGSISISLVQYRQFAAVIRDCAKSLALLPSRLQAIIWTERQYMLAAR